jgi:hypothetical protein
VSAWIEENGRITRTWCAMAGTMTFGLCCRVYRGRFVWGVPQSGWAYTRCSARPLGAVCGVDGSKGWDKGEARRAAVVRCDPSGADAL